MNYIIQKDILVLGVGNILLKDEGVGVHVVHKMQEISKLPQRVDLVEGGRHGVSLLWLVCKMKRLILVDAVDAVDADSEPGTIFKFTPQDIDQEFRRIHFSLDEIGPLEVLDMAKLCGMCLDTVVFGVQPKEIDWGLEMTSEVASKVPRVIELIMEEIGNYL